VVRIAISQAAFEAIAATFPLGSVGFEAEATGSDRQPVGERAVWLDEVWVDRLGAMHGPGETYSDVILRIAKAEGWGATSSGERRGEAAMNKGHFTQWAAQFAVASELCKRSYQVATCFPRPIFL
jgi:hypothetical protein